MPTAELVLRTERHRPRGPAPPPLSTPGDPDGAWRYSIVLRGQQVSQLPAWYSAYDGCKKLSCLVPRVAPATLGAGAGGGAPPSSSPSHFTEDDIYDQELGRPMGVKG